MNNYFVLFGKLFEKDAITTVCVVVLIAVVITAVRLYRKHNKTDNSPDLLDYDGYYKIALTPMGYAETDRNNLLRTLSTFYYLRKDPFNIEATIDNIEAKNGKKYRAMAILTVVMPEDRIDFVCRRYFGRNGRQSVSNAEIVSAVVNSRNSSSAVADILSGQKQSGKTNSDEMLKQILSGQAQASSGKSVRQEKTNCDADIDMELIIAFSAALKKLVSEQGGILSDEEIKKKFHGQAMLEAMETGHAVTEIPVLNIIEITE